MVERGGLDFENAGSYKRESLAYGSPKNINGLARLSFSLPTCVIAANARRMPQKVALFILPMPVRQYDQIGAPTQDNQDFHSRIQQHHRTRHGLFTAFSSISTIDIIEA